MLCQFPTSLCTRGCLGFAPWGLRTCCPSLRAATTDLHHVAPGHLPLALPESARIRPSESTPVRHRHNPLESVSSAAAPPCGLAGLQPRLGPGPSVQAGWRLAPSRGRRPHPTWAPRVPPACRSRRAAASCARTRMRRAAEERSSLPPSRRGGARPGGHGEWRRRRQGGVWASGRAGPGGLSRRPLSPAAGSRREQAAAALCRGRRGRVRAPLCSQWPGPLPGGGSWSLRDSRAVPGWGKRDATGGGLRAVWVRVSPCRRPGLERPPPFGLPRRRPSGREDAAGS